VEIGAPLDEFLDGPLVTALAVRHRLWTRGRTRGNTASAIAFALIGLGRALPSTDPYARLRHALFDRPTTRRLVDAPGAYLVRDLKLAAHPDLAAAARYAYGAAVWYRAADRHVLDTVLTAALAEAARRAPTKGRA